MRFIHSDIVRSLKKLISIKVFKMAAEIWRAKCSEGLLWYFDWISLFALCLGVLLTDYDLICCLWKAGNKFELVFANYKFFGSNL